MMEVLYSIPGLALVTLGYYNFFVEKKWAVFFEEIYSSPEFDIDY